MVKLFVPSLLPLDSLIQKLLLLVLQAPKLWPKSKLASTWMDVHDESTSMSMDANTKIRRFKASSGDLLHLEGSLDEGEGFPNLGLAATSTENPREGCGGDFLALPKESFNSRFDPFGDFVKGKQELDGKIPCRQDPQLAADDAAVNTSKRPDVAVKFFRTEQETVLPYIPNFRSFAHEDIPWLRVVDVAVLLLVRASRGVRSRLSSRSRHLRDLVQAMQTQAHTQAALQAQLEAQV
ncbi:hypothetical protein Taro_009058 [Colocasia esculenta]|uniref:Uncharacterized protein n=1 Tax=Colocasia esculenta TaxID=4460 RepID=A0A843U4Q4_COLES|nr:hypothetical protein [Colocasia esculenta]